MGPFFLFMTIFWIYLKNTLLFKIFGNQILLLLLLLLSLLLLLLLSLPNYKSLERIKTKTKKKSLLKIEFTFFLSLNFLQRKKPSPKRDGIPSLSSIFFHIELLFAGLIFCASHSTCFKKKNGIKKKRKEEREGSERKKQKQKFTTKNKKNKNSQQKQKKLKERKILRERAFFT